MKPGDLVRLKDPREREFPNEVLLIKKLTTASSYSPEPLGVLIDRRLCEYSIPLWKLEIV